MNVPLFVLATELVLCNLPYMSIYVGTSLIGQIYRILVSLLSDKTGLPC